MNEENLKEIEECRTSISYFSQKYFNEKFDIKKYSSLDFSDKELQIFVLYHLLFKENKHIAVLFEKEKIAREFQKELLNLFSMLPAEIIPTILWKNHVIKFSNNSLIRCGTSHVHIIRGISYDLIFMKVDRSVFNEKNFGDLEACTNYINFWSFECNTKFLFFDGKKYYL